MKSDDLDQMLRDALSGTAPAEVQEGAQRHFDDLAARLQQPTVRSSERKRRHPLWWLWSGLGLAGAAAVIMLGVSFFFTPAVSWAQVEEKFRALRFFNITMYVTSDTDEPSEKMEIWASQDHRCRVHYRGLIFFGREGKVVKVLRAATGEELNPDVVRNESYREHPELPDKARRPLAEMALRVPQMLSTTSNFSITELVTLFGGHREQLQPVPNLDASLASDMPVFDFTVAHSPYWFRLWVLKKSELPIRIRGWSPDTNEQIEEVFDYFTQMPDEAFDPEKVKAAITGKQGTANKLYALLKDPGKRPLTPEDVFAQTGYHLPEIESIGRTEDGVVWVRSKHSMNKTPSGALHFGWGVLTDNLGQKYPPPQSIGKDYGAETSLEYYVPLDYHGKYQKPQSYTLTCVDGEDSFWLGTAGTVIGSVQVKEWKDNTPIPKYQPWWDPSERKFTEGTLYRLYQLRDWDRFDRLAATIPGEPAEGNLALFRDMWLAEKLDLIRQPKQALALRARIYPMLKPSLSDYFDFESQGIGMAGYVASLLREGKRDEARKVANESVAALKKAELASPVYYLLVALHEAGMSEAEARQFFDTDVFATPLLKEELERNNFFLDGPSGKPVPPPPAAWSAFVTKLAARYTSQPLPEEFEFIDEQPALNGEQVRQTLPLPGHEGYEVALFPADSDARKVAVRLASPLGLDASQIVVATPVAKKLREVVCVYRKDAQWAKIWAAYLRSCGVEISETTTPRKALVAHYDRRKLPFPREVFPIDGKSRGLKLISRDSGANLEANHVFASYQEALNFGLDAGDPRRMLIVNETGLSESARPKQTYPDSYLAEQSAFWSGPGADELARDWFRDNFGITFQEEERPLKVIELHPLP